MKVSDFKKFFEEELAKPEIKIMFEKGLDYTEGSDDKLRNFKVLGELLEERYDFVPKGRGKYIVWEIYYRKHDSSVGTFLKFMKVSSEPIIGRIHDMRNYLALLAAMIKEDEEPAGMVHSGFATSSTLRYEGSSMPVAIDKLSLTERLKKQKKEVDEIDKAIKEAKDLPF